jgi:hypothetical protein
VRNFRAIGSPCGRVLQVIFGKALQLLHAEVLLIVVLWLLPQVRQSGPSVRVQERPKHQPAMLKLRFLPVESPSKLWPSPSHRMAGWQSEIKPEQKLPVKLLRCGAVLGAGYLERLWPFSPNAGADRLELQQKQKQNDLDAQAKVRPSPRMLQPFAEKCLTVRKVPLATDHQLYQDEHGTPQSRQTLLSIPPATGIY